MTPQEQAARAIEAARAIAAMTPQEKAARVIGAIQMGDPPDRPLSPIMLAVMAESIRAAADLVLPEEAGWELNDPRGAIRDYQRLSRQDARAQFLAIAAELEAPADG